MKTLSLFTIAAALLLPPLTTVAADKKADPTGTWTWTTPGRDGGPGRTNTLKLKLEGDKLTGTMSGRQQDTAIGDATLKGEDISFTVTREFQGNKMVQKYTGKLAGDTIKGKVSFERNGEAQTRDWEAKREVAKPKAPEAK